MPARGDHRRISVSAETCFVIGVTLLAAALRFYHLSSVPNGLHGDEAVAGLEAQRILREGSIGPYSRFALGQPSAPLYLDAISVWLFGNTVFAVRMVPALLGTLCTPTLYGFLARHLSRPCAGLAAGLLAVLGWHIHFSRIGFPLVSWALCSIVAMWMLFEAIERKNWKWWCAAGAACGFGIYCYNAAPLLIVAEVAYFIAWLCVGPQTSWKQRCCCLLEFGVGLLAVALPMLTFALTPHSGYLGHPATVSIFGQPQWLSLTGSQDKLLFLVQRYLDYWKTTVWSPRVNGVDASGVVALLPPSLAVATAVGMAFGLARRQPVVIYAAWLILVLPIAGVVTFDGAARRTFVLTVAIAILAAYGLTELYRLMRRRVPRLTPVAVLLLSVWCVWFGVHQLRGYFVVTANSTAVEWDFCSELVDAITYMKTLPRGTTIYYLSNRWGFNYEPRRYLAPLLHAQDRSKQSEPQSFAIDDKDLPVTFVLLGTDRDKLDLLLNLYPQGNLAHGPPTHTDGRPSFIAYTIPKS